MSPISPDCMCVCDVYITSAAVCRLSERAGNKQWSAAEARPRSDSLRQRQLYAVHSRHAGIFTRNLASIESTASDAL